MYSSQNEDRRKSLWCCIIKAKANELVSVSSMSFSFGEESAEKDIPRIHLRLIFRGLLCCHQEINASVLVGPDVTKQNWNLQHEPTLSLIVIAVFENTVFLSCM